MARRGQHKHDGHDETPFWGHPHPTLATSAPITAGSDTKHETRDEQARQRQDTERLTLAATGSGMKTSARAQL